MPAWPLSALSVLGTRERARSRDQNGGWRWLDIRYRPRRKFARIATFGADLLVVSYGADTFAGDPISGFRIETADYAAMGATIAGAGLRTLVVMEGGYAVEALGANVSGFLPGVVG